MALTLTGCGYSTPAGGLSPNIRVVTPTVKTAPVTTASPTVAPTTPAGVATSNPTTTGAAIKTAQPTLVINPDGTYTIKAGDTLSGVASRLNVDLDELINLNNLKDPNNLQIGQILKIPPRK